MTDCIFLTQGLATLVINLGPKGGHLMRTNITPVMDLLRRNYYDVTIYPKLSAIFK